MYVIQSPPLVISYSKFGELSRQRLPWYIKPYSFQPILYNYILQNISSFVNFFIGK